MFVSVCGFSVTVCVTEMFAWTNMIDDELL